MADEPVAKKAKVLNDDELRDALSAMDSVQAEVDQLNEKASEEILKVEQKFNALRKPIYERRTAAIENIVGFWPTSLINHPQLSTFIAEIEEPLLAKMSALDITEFEDIKSGFKMKFTFAENEYMENSTITKEFFLSAHNPHVKISDIHWKAGKNLLEKLRDNKSPVSPDQQTFIEWLCDTEADPTVDEVAELIKDDLWPNPLQYFLLPDIADEDVGEDDLEDVEGGDDA